MIRPTFGSLFSGIGGFDLGMERAGFRCVWQVEIDPFRRRVLDKHWPGVARHDDIRTFPRLPPNRFQCDVVCGGFPCKQTSQAAAIHGKRLGLEGRDSGLWYEMLRVVRLVRPRWVVVENVAGAKSYSTEIEAGLESLGYKIPGGPVRVSASDFAAPHRRQRLFWVAHRYRKGLAIPGITRPPQTQSVTGRTVDRDDWATPQPRVLRMDDGVPDRVDPNRRTRIQALGDAVTPAQGEWIGKCLMSHHKKYKG